MIKQYHYIQLPCILDANDQMCFNIAAMLVGSLFYISKKKRLYEDYKGQSFDQQDNTCPKKYWQL